MLVNDIKKGMRVQLRNGWTAELLDSKKGNIRTARVFGNFTEVGSIYAKDIQLVWVGERWELVELSDAQKKAAQLISAAGF